VFNLFIFTENMKRKQSKSPVPVTPVTSAPDSPTDISPIIVAQVKSHPAKKVNRAIQTEKDNESELSVEEESEGEDNRQRIPESQQRKPTLAESWRELDLHYLYLDIKNIYWTLDDALARFSAWNPSIGDCWLNKESSELVLAFRSEDAAKSAKEQNPNGDDFVWISSLMDKGPILNGMKIFLNPVLKKENRNPPGKQDVIDACVKHVALNIIANRIEEVVNLSERDVIMITFQSFDLHTEVENAVQDPRNNGEKIMIEGRFYRITVPPVERPTDNSTYELYFGNFPGFARVLPVRSYLYTTLKIHIKYITCPPGRRGGRSNFLFVGLPNNPNHLSAN